MPEKWEEKLVELEEDVVEYIRTIPRSDRHRVIHRLYERIGRLQKLVDSIDDID
jgi:hypothetical protein